MAEKVDWAAVAKLRFEQMTRERKQALEWRTGFIRYNKVRKLWPKDFEALHRKSIQNLIPFDRLVDLL